MRHLHDLAGQIKVCSHSPKLAVPRASSAACVTRWLINICSRGLSRDRPRNVVVVRMLLKGLAGHFRRRLQKSSVRLVTCKQPEWMPRWCVTLVTCKRRFTWHHCLLARQAIHRAAM